MTVQTGDLPTGFLQSAVYDNRGTNYGWGIGTCILRAPHRGVAAMLSPGTFGHGGAWGTQAWIDPVRGAAFYAAIRRYWPALKDGALAPAYSGVRPKLQGPGEPARDFLLQGPEAHGVAGLMNLFGIESPGLTASLAIACEAARRLGI